MTDKDPALELWTSSDSPIDLDALMKAAKVDAVTQLGTFGRAVFPCNGRRFQVNYRLSKGAKKKDHYSLTLDGTYVTEEHFQAALDRAQRMECMRSRLAKEHLLKQAQHIEGLDNVDVCKDMQEFDPSPDKS